jgi:hypothetical protein
MKTNPGIGQRMMLKIWIIEERASIFHELFSSRDSRGAS